MAASLTCSLGIHLYATNRGSFTNVGMPPTREKGSHLPPRTTKHCNLRNSHNSITAPSAKPDPGFSSWYKGCCCVEPTQGCQKCDRSTFSGVAQVHWINRYTHTMLVIYPACAIRYRWVVICALLNTRFKGRR